jgi:hypothetical protein
MSLCECEYDGDAQPTLWRETVRSARKNHRCDDCGGLIPSGQKYKRIDYKWEGEFDSCKVCIGCQEIRKVFSCPAVGDLKRAVLDELYEGDGDLPLVDLGPAGSAKMDEFLAAYETLHGQESEAVAS